MGFNTTLFLCNDALDSIENDQELGVQIADAVRELTIPEKHRRHASAAGTGGVTAIETHHADGYAVSVVGGNFGECVGHSTRGGLDALVDVLRSQGYRVAAPGERRAK